MAGVLVTSIGSGQLISRLGRYKPFPIVGTALMTVAMFLLSGISVSMPIWQTALYMLVLGLGLGMTMQVLVLAAQNAVPYRAARRRHLRLDALPAGRRLDRRLALRRDLRQPARQQPRRRAAAGNASFRTRSSPEHRRAAPAGGSRALPRRVRRGARAGLRVAAAVSLVALRAHLAAAGGAAAQERGGRGHRRELRDAHATRSRCRSWSGSWRPWRAARTAGASTRSVAEHAGVDLDPTELWLLGRLGEEAAIDLTDPRLAAAGASLRERGLIEDSRLAGDGQAVYGRVLATRRRRLAELLDGWAPEDHDEVRAMLDAFAREFVAEPPITA